MPYTMERCWLYLIVSSKGQEETLPSQRRWGFEQAARLGMAVDPRGVFEGIYSGKDSARALLRDLIGRLEALPKTRRPARVLMTRLDRVGRMPLDAISAINDIRRLGVIIHMRTDGDLTFERVIDMIGPIFATLQAGLENENRSDKSRAGHRRRREEGKLVATKPPYGVMRDRSGKGVADQKCAPIVREVFKRWARGDGPADIVLWLRKHAPTREGKKANYALRWSLSHVYKMVHLRTYRDWKIVSPDLWKAAQARKRKRSRPGPGGRVYPFAGILCSCGDRLHPRTNTSPTRFVLKSGKVAVYQRKTQRVWYVCQSMKHKSGPKFRSFREDEIERNWVAILQRLKPSQGTWKISPDKRRSFAESMKQIERRLEALTARRERIHSAFEDGAYDRETMQRRLSTAANEERKLRDELAALQAQQESIAAVALTRERATYYIRNAAHLYAKASRRRRAEVNAILFEIFGMPMIMDDHTITLTEMKRIGAPVVA